MLYPLLRPLLFSLDAERAHRLVFSTLDLAARLRLAGAVLPPIEDVPVEAMGLRFPNPVGLAAGLDKNAEHIAGLASLGFGFIECGTVTPRPQPGNPRPRLFRLPDEQALINRLGFNNAGLDAFVRNLAAKRARFRGVLGANIGKNFDTPIERAADDYIACLRAVCPHADYVTVNISSPNTKNLRDLQSPEALGALLRALNRERSALADRHGRRTPLAVKIAPDLDDEQLASIARLLAAHRIDAVIATNTTLSREGVADHRLAGEAGGLSGRPLRARSTEVVRKLARLLDGALPIIAVGGILSGEDAREKVAAGATLVQLYTGLVYRGPTLVAEVARALRAAPGPAAAPPAIAAGRMGRD